MGYSLGFWLDHNDNPKNRNNGNFKIKSTVELHFNYWSIESKEKFHYLDIGVKIKSIDNELDSVNFYFPFTIKNNEYMPNLGGVICSKVDLLELIFNEQLESKKAEKNYDDITFKNKEEILRIYKELSAVNQEDCVLLTHNNDGTTRLSFTRSLFKFNDDDLEKKVWHYFRFRLKLTPDNVKKLSQNYAPEDRLLLSRFDKMEIIDFRINELRDLPSSICNVLNENFTLRRIDFFLIRDIYDELQLSHAEYKRCRLLEKEVWKDYLVFSKKELLLPSQMLIYHFCEKNQKKDGTYNHLERFNAFAKFSRLQVTPVSIFFFIFSVIILGALGSTLSSLFINNAPELNIFNSNYSNDSIYNIILYGFIFLVVIIFIYILLKKYTFQSILKRK